MPEVDASDVDIQLEGNALTLRGERKLENAEKQEGYHRVERSYGAFSRRFTLPTTVEAGNVTAQSRDGVLRIFLPRRRRRSRAESRCRPAASGPAQAVGPQLRPKDGAPGKTLRWRRLSLSEDQVRPDPGCR